MANLVKWNDIDKHMGEILYEEWRVLNRCVKCKPIEYMDIVHMKFEYDDGQKYTAIMGYTPDVRYWDGMPTDEDKVTNYWG